MNSEEEKEEELEIGETEEERRQREEKEKRGKQREKIKASVQWAIGIIIAVAMVLLAGGLIFGIRTMQGISILTFAGLLLLLKVVHKPDNWIVEFFGQYFDTWKPRFLPYVLIPGIMTVKEKVPTDTTIIIDLFMDEVEHLKEDGSKVKRSKIDYKDDSAATIMRVKARIENPMKVVYQVTTVGGWRYLIEEQTDSVSRGVCGGIPLDDAIAARITPPKEAKREKSLSEEIQEKIKGTMKPYGIIIEEVLITDIKLSDDTEKQRRAIHLAEKKVREEAFNLQASEKKGIGLGLEKSREITEIIRLVKEETKETLTPLQVMTYIRQEDLLEAAGKGTLIATSGGLEKGIADVGAIAAGISAMLKKKGGE